MSWNRIDIPTGTRFGKWVVTGEPVPYETSGGNRFLRSPVICDCGYITEVRTYQLRKGLSRACKKCCDGKINSGNFRKGAEHFKYLGPGNTRLDIKRAWLFAEKSQPCVDCGRSFPYYCMELDHVPERGRKRFMVNLNACQSRKTLDELKEERKKCDLVCSVCHDHRTWERTNNLPHVPLNMEEPEC